MNNIRCFAFVVILILFNKEVNAQDIQRLKPNRDNCVIGSSIFITDSLNNVLDKTAPIFRRTIIGEDCGTSYAIADIRYSFEQQTDNYSNKRLYICLNNELNILAMFPVGTMRVSEFRDGISISGAGLWIDPIPGKQGAISITGTVLFNNDHYSTIRIGNGWAAAIDPIIENADTTTYTITYKNVDGRSNAKQFKLSKKDSWAIVKTFPFIDFELFDIYNEDAFNRQFIKQSEENKTILKKLNELIKDVNDFDTVPIE